MMGISLIVQVAPAELENEFVARSYVREVTNCPAVLAASFSGWPLMAEHL
jgi:hypothetical protein